MHYNRDALALLGVTLLARSAGAYDCRVVTRKGTTNHGPALPETAHKTLTPFSLGDYSSSIAFDEDHCIQMCCEHMECFVAVFDEDEATCYLKGPGALHTYDFKKEDGINSHEMLFREGSAAPIAMEPTECKSKRGLAFDFKDAADLTALSLGMSWWYNWSPAIMSDEMKRAQSTSGCEYIPMIWGTKDTVKDRLDNLDALGTSSHLLGFNEPNFGAQASLTPAQAASIWSTVQAEAKVLGADIVSPAVNFCGGDCNEEDPYKWLDEFFEACDKLEGGCGVTAVAVHSYTCEAKYLNKILHGYLKYDLPLWLTEFACGDEAEGKTESAQAAYLKEALLLLELHPSVERYAWFTGRGAGDMGVTGADLLAGTGVLTDVGKVFVDTYQNLQRCGGVTGSLIDSSDDDATPSLFVAVPGESTGLTDVDPTAEEITNVVISNLGGVGSYKEVMSMAPGEDMKCSDEAAACVQQDVTVEGTLSPFDEGMSIAFRGPMNLHNIVWYEGNTSSLNKTSAWTPTASDNLVFLNNLGGSPGCSGEWTICGGSSQSFSDASGDSCTNTPTLFAGVVGSDEEVQISTANECGADSNCGFYRGTGMQGWRGGSDGTKVMVFEVDMPHCGTNGFKECQYNRPAVWALNSKVVRTAQYGCNCRGMGGNGGCGEFDIIEAVIGVEHADMMFTTVYDYKGTGSPGENKYFLRPSAPTNFAAIFRGGANAYLQVVQLTEFDYSQGVLSGAFLDSLKAASVENHQVYNVPAP